MQRFNIKLEDDDIEQKTVILPVSIPAGSAFMVFQAGCLVDAEDLVRDPEDDRLLRIVDRYTLGAPNFAAGDILTLVI